MTIGFVELSEGSELRPGVSIEVTINFVNWSGLDGQIYLGRQWRIQEGPKLVGIGTILEVVATS